eukprot:gnl/TRDRNA2_/TRDRNA2_190011_c0_seq1.p1 gnl/TRDRNA2_/TRDRNA2_190011_c0~~gnl/TRDRNA2_/TRDRNA2_190011_c0_seq1.p1  ORF type:complete len:375 (+),score=115.25 gnl/TRDRNA2_/TRDRNA2_190011_c0_seq1:29-1126(+)
MGSPTDLAALRQAAEARAAELHEAKAQGKVELESLESEIAVKKEERSIAAQEAVRTLQKKRETLQKDLKSLDGACAVVEKAVARISRAVELGCADWKSIHEEKVKVSEYVKERLEGSGQDALLKALRAKCQGELSVKAGALHFAGDKAELPKLQAALEALESAQVEQAWVEGEEDTLKLFEARGELARLAKRHAVEVGIEGGSIWISGPPKGTAATADMLKSMLEYSEDVDVPKALIGAAKAKAKEVEPLTGAFVEVGREGWGGGGTIWIRGAEDCVKDAAAQLREWLDAKEGAVSEFVDVSKQTAGWTAPIYDQFRNDLGMMGQKFGIAVKTRDEGQLEVRGPADAVKAGKAELKMILDFYMKK